MIVSVPTQSDPAWAKISGDGVNVRKVGCAVSVGAGCGVTVGVQVTPLCGPIPRAGSPFESRIPSDATTITVAKVDTIVHLNQLVLSSLTSVRDKR